jgi:hypothetical protein
MKIGRTKYTAGQTERIEQTKEQIACLQSEIDLKYSNLLLFLAPEDDGFLWDYIFNDFKLEIEDE